MISWRRVWAVVLRHLYNFRRSLDRLTDAFYWPSMDIIIWGLTISALQKQGTASHLQIAMILFAAILWYIVWRGQGEITIGLLEEIWSENLGNLFATPLKTIEWMIAACILGFIKLIMTVVFTALMAFIFYKVNFLSIGLSVVPFITSLLVFGWAFGFFVGGLFLRNGTNIQTLAWAGGFALMPFSAVFYRFELMPSWMQLIGTWLPTTYIFEGLRATLTSGIIPWEMILKSFGLNIFYLSLGILYFYISLEKARQRGLSQLH